MSMSFAYLAISGPVELVVESWLEQRPSIEVQEVKRGLLNFEQLYEWCSSRSGYLEGRFPNDTTAIFQHAGWSVIIDFSMSMSSDDNFLNFMSENFGECVTVTTQGTAGFSSYSYHDLGALKRRITSIDGQVEEEGTKVLAENRIDVSRFHIHEADILWQAHGLPSFLLEPHGKFTAIHYIDRSGAPPAVPEGGAAPWWTNWKRDR